MCRGGVPGHGRARLVPQAKKRKMRPLAIVAVLLIVLGVLALAVPSITFFTREPVVDTGFFHIDWQKPHTIILNPMVGIVALGAGLVLLLAAPRPSAQ